MGGEMFSTTEDSRTLFEQATGLRALADSLPKLQAAALRKLADDCEAQAVAQINSHPAVDIAA
jgi:hypothetical protein